MSHSRAACGFESVAPRPTGRTMAPTQIGSSASCCRPDSQGVFLFEVYELRVVEPRLKIESVARTVGFKYAAETG